MVICASRRVRLARNRCNARRRMAAVSLKAQIEETSQLRICGTFSNRVRAIETAVPENEGFLQQKANRIENEFHVVERSMSAASSLQSSNYIAARLAIWCYDLQSILPERLTDMADQLPTPALNLKALAEVKFGKPPLSDAEKLLLEKVVTGGWAFCGPVPKGTRPNGSPPSDDKDSDNDPEKADTWVDKEKRQIRAELVAWLCTDRQVQSCVHG